MDTINIVALRKWSALCALAKSRNQQYDLWGDRSTPDTIDPDAAAMCRFIMTFYPEDKLESFDDD